MLVNNMRRYLMKEPKKRELDYQRRIGKEVVDVGDQVLRTFVVSLPLQTTIFGDKYNKLKVREVVRDTNNTLLIHIASKKRIEELLTVSGQCAVDINTDDLS